MGGGSSSVFGSNSNLRWGYYAFLGLPCCDFGRQLIEISLWPFGLLLNLNRFDFLHIMLFIINGLIFVDNAICHISIHFVHLISCVLNFLRLHCYRFLPVIIPNSGGSGGHVCCWQLFCRIMLIKIIVLARLLKDGFILLYQLLIQIIQIRHIVYILFISVGDASLRPGCQRMLNHDFCLERWISVNVYRCSCVP